MSSASWLVYTSTSWSAAVDSVSIPQARMKRRARSISLASASKRCPAGLLATNSCVQAWTRDRSAKPPLVNARSRFSVDADWW